MALKIAAVQGGMALVLEDSDFENLKSISTQKLCDEIRDEANYAEIDQYRKSTRGPKKTTLKKKLDKRAVQVSVAKVLAESRR